MTNHRRDAGAGTPARASREKVRSLAAAAREVADGDRIGFGGSNALWRRPLAFARELVRQRRTGLHAFNMLGGLEVDLLLGAGALASTNCCYVGLDDLGQSEHFQRAAREHSVEINEYTEFTFVAGLRAAGMDLPFMPWKSAWGSEVVERLGWETIVCPYTGAELLAVPATELDVAVILVPRADPAGNVELSNPPDFIGDFDLLVARAARRVIVCAEEVGPVREPTQIAMIGREVDTVVHTPRGGWPGGMAGRYQVDARHMAERYLPATADPAAFRAYLDEFVAPGEPADG